MEGQQGEITQGTKILFYVLSFFIPLAGIIIGIIYMGRPDEESKQLGRTCLYIAIAVIVLGCLCGVLGSVVPALLGGGELFGLAPVALA
jgi:hypothetical protein